MLPELEVGDCLIYTGLSFFDILIRLKTWSYSCHVEIYVGGGKSVASRNFKGVDIYPLRLEGLYKVRRVNPLYGKFDKEKAMQWFYSKAQGQAYDLIGLLSFVYAGWSGDPNKMFCSEFATRAYREGTIWVMADDWDADHTAPAQLEQTPALLTTWTCKD